MASQFTPGPWRLAENDKTIVVTEALDAEGNCSVIADVLTYVGRAGEHDFANARLIAASPDLLNEHINRLSDLMMLRKAIAFDDPKGELLVRIDDMLRDTRTIITKARGAA